MGNWDVKVKILRLDSFIGDYDFFFLVMFLQKVFT